MTPSDQIVLTGLKIYCIIGIFEWERKRKQPVVLDIRFPADIRKAAHKDRIEDTVDYKKIAKTAIAFVEKSQFQLIETLAERLADHLLSLFNLPEIYLRASKPGAIRGSQNVGVEITRKNDHHPEGLVYFSLGSNLMASFHLKNALKEIDHQFGLKAVSHVYETSPVGSKKNQPDFWNMVVAVDTHKKLGEIHGWIGQFEKKEGRARTRDRYASRTLDVDLILWKDRVIQGKGFALPHPDIETKAFVLFPFLEICPNWIHPKTNKSIIEIGAEFNEPSQKIHQLPGNLFSPYLPLNFRK